MSKTEYLGSVKPRAQAPRQLPRRLVVSPRPLLLRILDAVDAVLDNVDTFLNNVDAMLDTLFVDRSIA